MNSVALLHHLGLISCLSPTPMMAVLWIHQGINLAILSNNFPKGTP